MQRRLLGRREELLNSILRQFEGLGNCFGSPFEVLLEGRYLVALKIREPAGIIVVGLGGALLYRCALLLRRHHTAAGSSAGCVGAGSSVGAGSRSSRRSI